MRRRPGRGVLASAGRVSAWRGSPRCDGHCPLAPGRGVVSVRGDYEEIFPISVGPFSLLGNKSPRVVMGGVFGGNKHCGKRADIPTENKVVFLFPPLGSGPLCRTSPLISMS